MDFNDILMTHNVTMNNDEYQTHPQAKQSLACLSRLGFLAESTSHLPKSDVTTTELHFIFISPRKNINGYNCFKALGKLRQLPCIPQGFGYWLRLLRRSVSPHNSVPGLASPQTCACRPCCGQVCSSFCLAFLDAQFKQWRCRPRWSGGNALLGRSALQPWHVNHPVRCRALFFLISSWHSLQAVTNQGEH